MPHIVILGAGFAGTAAAINLGRKRCAKVTLISRRNFHLFTPLLYQAATGLVDIEHLAQTVRSQARKFKFAFLEGEARSIDLNLKVVRTDFGDVSYDYLVLAVGSESNDFGIKGVLANSLPLKTLTDAEKMHNRIVGALEQAEVERDDEKRTSLLTFVVIGGGSTGVELAGSIRDFLRLMKKEYPVLTSHGYAVIEVEAFPQLLPGLSEYMSAKATEILSERGIELRLSSKVMEVNEQGVLLESGETIRSGNVFWTAGIKPPQLVKALDVEKERGRIKVDGHMRILSHPEVFAIGDIAWVPDAKSGTRLPETAQVAVREGKWLGTALPRLLAGENVAPFAYAYKGHMLSLGRNVGVVDLGWLKTSGFFGWLIWRTVHISQISAARNRLGVAFDWTLAYFNRRNSAHLED